MIITWRFLLGVLKAAWNRCYWFF